MKFNIEDVMKFDIKDIKSWSNRKDVKIGDKGYFANDIHFLDDIVSMNLIGAIEEIDENDVLCFKKNSTNNFGFFLPADAVKKDKSKKKYRPFKSMRELTEIVYSKDWEYDNLSVGDSLWIRRKGDEHYHQNLLITSLGYDENDLISLNGKPMQEWLDNFEFLAHSEWWPFGVEVKEND